MLRFPGLWVMPLQCGCWVVCVKIMFWALPGLDTDSMSKGITTTCNICSQARAKDAGKPVCGFHMQTPTEGSESESLNHHLFTLPGFLSHSPFTCHHTNILDTHSWPILCPSGHCDTYCTINRINWTLYVPFKIKRLTSGKK